MSKFQVGQLVYATQNSMWGREPMKVIRVSDNWISVKNKGMGGIGAFRPKELECAVKLGKAHAIKLLRLEKLEKEATSLEKELFSKKRRTKDV